MGGLRAISEYCKEQAIIAAVYLSLRQREKYQIYGPSTQYFQEFSSLQGYLI
jgi:hypothetical protein